MKVVVDTSVWIEWLVGSALGIKYDTVFEAPETIILPTIVQLELSKWITREAKEASLSGVLAFMTACQTIPLTTQLALAASDQHRRHKLATADAIIYATALAYEATLLTFDSHFQNLRYVRFEPKGG